MGRRDKHGRLRQGKVGARARLALSVVLTMLAVAPLGLAQDRLDPTPRAASGGVYRRPLGSDPATLDPGRINDLYGRSVAHQIFDGLVQFDQTLTISPALARHWRGSRDGLTWTFSLRPGVKFHHGREVTSDDVVFTLTRIIDPRTKSEAADLFLGIQGARDFREGRARTVAGLSALDRHTVRVQLQEATVPFVSLLAIGQAKIVPRDLVEQQGDAFGTQPVGTGPFRFVRWDRGREIVLSANLDSFDGVPRLSRLVYRIFAGELNDLMCQEFGQGNLEESPVPPSCRNKVTDPRYLYVRRPTFNVRFYGLNARVRPLNDVRVRQAIVHAIDRDTIVQEIFLGRHATARGILPPGMPGYNPQLKPLPHSEARARELLRAAGYPDGRGLPPIALWSSVKGERIERELATVKRQLAQVGIPLEIHYETNWPSFTRLLGEGRLPMFIYAWYADVPDADNFLYKLFHSRSPRNLTGYANPLVDDLLLQARAERDLPRRIQIYRRVEQVVVDEAPVVPVWHYAYERLFQSYVKNIEANGLGDAYLPLRKMWIEPAR
ncbi:MAG TPA: ABC transporter substrate-binding protein [Candidatus Limnocylindrales bacterium]|nr:ABC transporter substrate-binding protein [Candidatus Limnocylindrales bacterium]